MIAGRASAPAVRPRTLCGSLNPIFAHLPEPLVSHIEAESAY